MLCAHRVFFVFQMLKERLCFDPEFWNLLTIRTHCLELMSDKVMKAAVLNEMREEEEKEYHEELLTNNCIHDPCTQGLNSCESTEAVNRSPPEEKTLYGKTGKCVAPSNNALLKRRKWRRSLRRKKQPVSDDEVDLGDDPEFKYNLKAASSGSKPVYSLRRNHTNVENSAPIKLPIKRSREYLSRCVKSQILKRKGRKKRWLQGLPILEQVQVVKEKKVKVKGKKRGRKPLQKLELSYPDNELSFTEEEAGFEEETDTDDKDQDMPHLENELEKESEHKENQSEQMHELEKENGLENQSDPICGIRLGEHMQEESQTQLGSKQAESLLSEPQVVVPAVEAAPEFDGPPLELLDCPIELLHSYSLKSKKPDTEKQPPPEASASVSASDELNGDAEQKPQPTVTTEESNTEVSLSRLVL